MIANYHTHTSRCGHAAPDSDEVYVQRAIQNGLRILGFSDHTPWPYKNGFTHRQTRMVLEQLPEYIESVQSLREKYRGQIQIYLGLECEYFPEYLPWLREQAKQMDYLILGNHFGLTDEHGEANYAYSTHREDVEAYTQYTLAGMETGLFRVLAHPDMIFADYPRFDDACETASYALCRKAKELDLPIEYNLLGVEKRKHGRTKGLGYPCTRFWEIAAETGCTAIIGCDAHQPEMINVARGESAERTLKSLGIRTLDTLEGLE